MISTKQLKTIDFYIERQELDALNIIKNKISCAKQALNINIIPEKQEDATVKQYLQGVIDILAGYTWLEQVWWDGLFEKYSIEKGITLRIDQNNGRITSV